MKKLKFTVGQLVVAATDNLYKSTILETNVVDPNGSKFDYKDSYGEYWMESDLRPFEIGTLRCFKTMCHNPNCEDCYPLATLRKAAADTPCTCADNLGCGGCEATKRLTKRLQFLREPSKTVNRDRGYCPKCGDSIPECKCTSDDFIESAEIFAARPCTCNDAFALKCMSCAAKIAMSIRERNQLVKNLQAYFRKDKKLKPLAKHVREGLELMDYYLNVLKVIDGVPSPTGVEHEFVVYNTSKKSEKKVQVVDWLFNTALKAAMEDEKKSR